MSLIGPTVMLNSMAEQLDALMFRHQQGGDTVELTLNSGVVVTGLKEFSIEQYDPELGSYRQNKTCQVRFPVSELKGAQLGTDFVIGCVCYINQPIVQPGYENKIQDPSKWELQYYRLSTDGLLASVGLKSND